MPSRSISCSATPLATTPPRADRSARQPPGTNKFNARVWRRMYLSTFMFGSDYTIEQPPGTDTTVLHIPVTFRGAMPAGAYPYPFWHSTKKWDAYNYTTTIHFIIQNGVVTGALRSLEQDTTRPEVEHTWDGLWQWEQQGVSMPYVSIYDYLLSKGNPYADKLNDTYRALEARMRQNKCEACHAPDNQGNSAQLEFFVYPNQALTGRHDIVTQLTKNEMPPKNNTLNLPVGIADSAERELLISLAHDFESAGDQALAWKATTRPSSSIPTRLRSSRSAVVGRVAVQPEMLRRIGSELGPPTVRSRSLVESPTAMV